MTQKFVDKAVLEQMRIWIYIRKPHLMDGETILTATAAVTPADLTLDGDVVISGQQVMQMMHGGEAGTTYLIQFTVTTSNGSIYCSPDHDAILVRVI